MNKFKIFISIIIITISIQLHGQEKRRVIAKYQDVERIGNFITRFYYDLIGTSLVWKRTLTLYSDSTYHYVYRGGECGTFDEEKVGSWTIEHDTLKLSIDIDGFIWHYIRANNKLYDLDTNPNTNRDNWVMKEKNMP